MQLPEAGTYKTACKPGMVGDGIRGDFTVSGDTVKIDDTGKFKDAADFYKKYVIAQTSDLVPATEAFAAAVKKGDVAGAKALYPKARTYYERIEPVAESFPNDLDPASTCAKPTSNLATSGPASTAWRRSCGSPVCSPTAAPWPISWSPMSRSSTPA